MTDENGVELLLSAGEASGDLHASRLMRELARLRPEVRCFGLGGEQMCEQGLDQLGDSREISVVGLTEALAVLPRARRIFHRLLDAARERRPRVAVLVDSPDFNLRLAARLRKLGVPVVYYVSPQVWAWRQGRVQQIARDVSKMLVLFEFEVEFYRRHGVSVEHVGHPLVDEVPLPATLRDSDSTRPQQRLVLLPGSRRSELEALLPVMLESAKALRAATGCEVELILAPGLRREDIEPYLERSESVNVVSSDRHRHVVNADLALCASGTATLEVGLLGTPMLVLYRVGKLTYWLAKRLVQVPHIALVNLVLGREVAPELLQDEATAERIVDQARELLGCPALLAEMRCELAEVRPALGRSGASLRAAEAVVECLEANR